MGNFATLERSCLSLKVGGSDVINSSSDPDLDLN